MTILDEMAEFTVGATLGDVSPAHRSELKIRILASLGCAIGALDSSDCCSSCDEEQADHRGDGDQSEKRPMHDLRSNQAYR
jgi:hypothetical protein